MDTLAVEYLKIFTLPQRLPIYRNIKMGDSAEKLLADLEQSKTLPLWAQMSRLNPPEPNPQCIPVVWEYEKIRPNLLRAGNLITEKQAERRVLMLVNPARGTSSTGSIYDVYTLDHSE